MGRGGVLAAAVKQPPLSPQVKNFENCMKQTIPCVHNNYYCTVECMMLFSQSSQTFRCVETAPLLCILLDCLHHVDDFFMKCETDEMEGERNGESLFLQGLEMYCLLQQRLRDMTYSWAAVVKCATPDLFRGTYTQQ